MELMTIRALEMTDIDGFMPLARQFAEQCSYLPFSKAMSEANFTAAIDSDEIALGAFDDNGDMVGFAHGEIKRHIFSESRVCFLYLIYVLPGHGLTARGLIKALEHEAKEQEVKEIYVGTIAGDYDSGALEKVYALMGYKQCGGNFKKEIKEG